MLSTEQINELIGVEESYQASFKLNDILFDKNARISLFNSFLKLEQDLSFDWFTNYFQEEHSNRKDRKQDFTPDGVTELASKLLGSFDSNADICAGTGGLTIKRWALNKHAQFYCEEYSDRAMPFLLFNLMIRNVNGIVVHGDTLTQEHKHIYKLVSGDCFSELEELNSLPEFFADTVIMNPPYSLSWKPNENMKAGLFADIGVLPPKSKADYAFLIRGLARLSDNGTQLLILPHGVLFRGSAEGKIRQWLIEHNYLDAVIGLPAKVFLNTDIPTVILMLKKKRNRKDVLFVDASKQFRKDKSHNVVEAEHINKILQVYQERNKVNKFSEIVTFETIKDNDFNLNIPRYVDTFEPEPVEPLDDILADMRELDRAIEKTGQELATMMNELRGIDEQADQEIKRMASYWIDKYGIKQTKGEQLSLL
ncbi:N-6 DNA methylase [Ligilactobacillus ruminis]|uniref:N-6 DNA methylase n=1 Tax=Ligilactobacillus ruminis TaxID=1623 RepID=UPI00232DBD66|nr:N-6 DNA methylase [Ligilactobacillus ruminis]MDB7636332.1 N-6 DNA methylase [Ligilactobacillus ruminis]MDB7679428.1 N-6 DNA methylase [Ligilactobacillus ruminis]